ncbi:MAG: regulatory protein RecX [Lachnospiraceae bacterium]|nr:regulatory protein RecX [Lachnospiraceae bacterium]
MGEMTYDELYKNALSTALRYISHRDRTEYEVLGRLGKDGYPEDIIGGVLSFLKEQGYVNDRRYAEYYIVCYKDKRSIRRILQELKNKGIDEELLSAVMQATDTDTSGAIRNAIKKQFTKRGIRDVEEISYEDKNKIMAALFRQGYSAEDIRKGMETYTI